MKWIQGRMLSYFIYDSEEVKKVLEEIFNVKRDSLNTLIINPLIRGYIASFSLCSSRASPMEYIFPAPIVTTTSPFFDFSIYSSISSKDGIYSASIPFLIKASTKCVEWTTPLSFSGPRIYRVL